MKAQAMQKEMEAREEEERRKQIEDLQFNAAKAESRKSHESGNMYQRSPKSRRSGGSPVSRG
jgi:hypothetical protein